MKARIFLKVAKTERGYKTKASLKPNYEALDNGYQYAGRIVYPTVQLCLDVDIDDKEFEAIKVELDKKIQTTRCVTVKDADLK